MSARVFTTFAMVDGMVPQAVVRAMHTNITNPAIKQIIVVTETCVDSLLEVESAFRHEKLKYIQREARPTFQDMFNVINHVFGNEQDSMAILMNSDISISDEKVVYRLAKALEEMTATGDRVAFSLTRYEEDSDGEHITLKSQLGMPNVISSDAWVFNAPVHCEKELYYSMGQMYCDKFINHDLIESGYNLYNPCLDCRVIHNERDLKDAAYYKALSDDAKSKDAIREHMKKSVQPGNGYYGLSRLRSVSMVAGYRPSPVRLSNSRKRLFVFLADNEYVDAYLDVILNDDDFIRSRDVDLYFVVESANLQGYIDTFLARVDVHSSVYVYFVDSIDGIIAELQKGVHDFFASIMLTANWSCVTREMLRLAGVIFYDARKDDQFAGLVKMLSSPEGGNACAGVSLQNDFRPGDYDWLDSRTINDTVRVPEHRFILFSEFDHAGVGIARFLRGNHASGVLFCAKEYAEIVRQKFKTSHAE